MPRLSARNTTENACPHQCQRNAPWPCPYAISLPPESRRKIISCSTGFQHQSGDAPTPAGYSFIHGVVPPFRQPSLLRRHVQYVYGGRERQGSTGPAPHRAAPLVPAFTIRGVRVERSWRFYTGGDRKREMPAACSLPKTKGYENDHRTPQARDGTSAQDKQDQLCRVGCYGKSRLTVLLKRPPASNTTVC